MKISYTLDIQTGAARLRESVQSALDSLPFKDDKFGLEFKHFSVSALLKGVETNADRLYQLLLPKMYVYVEPRSDYYPLRELGTVQSEFARKDTIIRPNSFSVTSVRVT